jgi:hypothetical protein
MNLLRFALRTCPYCRDGEFCSPAFAAGSRKSAVQFYRFNPFAAGVVCDGTIRIGDTLEAHAIRNFLGEHKLAVSSTKSMTGPSAGRRRRPRSGRFRARSARPDSPPTINLEKPGPRHRQHGLSSPTTRGRRRSNTRCRIRSVSAGLMAALLFKKMERVGGYFSLDFHNHPLYFCVLS